MVLCWLSHLVLTCPFQPQIQPNASIHLTTSYCSWTVRLCTHRCHGGLLCLCSGSSAPCWNVSLLPPAPTLSPIKSYTYSKAHVNFTVLLEACANIGNYTYSHCPCVPQLPVYQRTSLQMSERFKEKNQVLTDCWIPSPLVNAQYALHIVFTQ